MPTRHAAATDTREDLGYRPYHRNYQNLALGVIDHALRDATGTRAIAPDAQTAARSFIYSSEAEFWADAAGVNIWRLRHAYKSRTDDCDCDE
jgi:hypothetical protein